MGAKNVISDGNNFSISKVSEKKLKLPCHNFYHITLPYFSIGIEHIKSLEGKVRTGDNSIFVNALEILFQNNKTAKDEVLNCPILLERKSTNLLMNQTHKIYEHKNLLSNNWNSFLSEKYFRSFT